MFPNPAVVLPVRKRLLGGTHGDADDTRSAEAVLDDGVDGVAVGHVDRAPAVFILVGFEGFDGAENEVSVAVSDQK